MKPYEPVAVIFANGEDDDLPGYMAALRNEPILYGPKRFEKGDALKIAGQHLRFVCATLLVIDHGKRRALLIDPIGGATSVAYEAALAAPECKCGKCFIAEMPIGGREVDMRKCTVQLATESVG